MLLAAAVLIYVYRTGSEPEGSPTFAGVSLRLDYATTSVAQERGLGGRAYVPEDYGMLFVFDTSDYYGIWMKDMLVPIDIFWLDDNGHVVSMALDVSTSTYPDIFRPSARARYVLETAAGFGRRHDVATGTPLILDVANIF